MKTLILSLVSLLLLTPMLVMAEEAYMCSYYYKDVVRKVKNIKSYGSDLSGMARNTLFNDLEFDTKQCISRCEGQKFKYCNEIAKWISNN